MKIQTTRGRLLASTMICGVLSLGIAGQAFAADTTTKDKKKDDGTEVTEVVVTGSRLQRKDFTAISPVATVTSQQLEMTGTVAVEQLINELPQIVPGNTVTSNNTGGENFATVNLRGLGVSETLVVVNGERVPGSSTTGAVDLNTIPVGLIDRIEVLTGGASAVYGSDAMAGVVNFILKQNYEGAEISAQVGGNFKGQGKTFNVDGLIGGNFANGRGNMTMYANYFQRNPVLQSAFDWSKNSAAILYDTSNPSAGHYLYDTFVANTAAQYQSIVTANAAKGLGTGVYFSGGSGTPPWGWITNSGYTGVGFDTNNNGCANEPGETTQGLGGPQSSSGAFTVTKLQYDAKTGKCDLLTGNPFGDNGGAAIDPITGLPTTDHSFWNPAANNGNGAVVVPSSSPLSTLAATAAQFAAANTDCNAATGGVAVKSGNLSFNDAGQLTPRFTAGACSVPDRSAGSSRYNFAPTNDIIIPAKRYGISTFAHYDITDKITLKTQASFIDSSSGVQLAATPATGLTVVLTDPMEKYIAANHPDLAAALASRPNPTANFTEDWRSLQLGPRVAHFDDAALSMLATLTGKINDNWNWSVTASYGQDRFTEELDNNLNKTAIEQGLSGCNTPVAGSTTSLGVDMLPGCTIADIFGQNKLSANAVSFLRTNTHSLTFYSEQRVAGFIRGDLLQLPAGGLSTVVGAEYREDHASINVDDAQRTGDIYGFNAVQNQDGSVTVGEIYGEVGVPIIKDQPFIKYLGAEAGYRYSQYDTIGGAETYKIGGEWSPNSWLKFRAVYNKAVRAPNVFELFQNGDQGFPAYTDPCNAKGNRSAATLAICQAQAPGADFSAFAQNNTQVQAFSFGNPNLGPETGKTFTYGLVFQPDFLPVGHLKATIDVYDIKIENAIEALGATTVSNLCYASGSATSASCLKIQRDPITGQVVSINTSTANISELDTKGIDFEVDYNATLSDFWAGLPGKITVNELFSKLNEFTLDGTHYERTSETAIGTAYPGFKSVLTGTYGLGDWLFQARWTYVPKMHQLDFNNEYVGCNPDFFPAGTVCAFSTQETPAASLIDISARWNVTDTVQITGTIDNLFDKQPPELEDGVLANQANTDTQIYSVLGRTFTLAAKVRF